ncbi:cytochrome c oxidase subunit II [Haloarculaceae archaeon H-GB2-1]|nr:cytochrome c oxidase subunit II [Haloarculaceae archaeon H-GB1-1]MEA5387069.1 cytochrome c oxidase subunit II [Haloarculaceae archaeon H-GB11]MEA5408574.1 cytochrome c oxidase subunit II [Haloarculaceae archaeon H-GB2-1]
MEIHRFEKLWLAAGILLIVGFIATVTYGAVGEGVAMVNDDGGTIDPTKVSEDANFSDPGVEQVGPHEYEAHIVAQQFLFKPGTSTPIRVPANSTVTFYVTSSDVVHGFNIVGTNVNTMVIPGQVAKMKVRFEEPREYGIVCNEYCGAGHHTMAGTIEVVPEDDYEGGA